MLKQINKKLAKEWEANTTPILNIISGDANYPPNPIQQVIVHRQLSKLLSWYLQHGLKTTKERKNYLAKILGNPLYHVNYEYREAVWAFYFEETPCVLYYSQRGLSLQIDSNASFNVVKHLLKYLVEALASKD